MDAWFNSATRSSGKRSSRNAGAATRPAGDVQRGGIEWQTRYKSAWSFKARCVVNDGATIALETLGDIEVTVSVAMGTARRTIKEVLELREGSVVPLDVSASAQVQLLINGVTVATGEIVELDDGMLAIEISSVHGRMNSTAVV